MMIWEIIGGCFLGGTILETFGLFLLYRQYVTLAEVTIEYAEQVIESIEEQEDGSLSIDPITLAGNSMDHLSLISGLLKWIRI